MSSQSVAKGAREPARDQKGASRTGGVSTETSAGEQAGRGASHAERTRGSPAQATPESDSLAAGNAVGFLQILRETLHSDEMTSRTCRIILTLAAGLTIVMLSLVAVVVTVMVKAPAEFKWVLSVGPVILISGGSWVRSRRRGAKKTPALSDRG
jgi:hypothetical protein